MRCRAWHGCRTTNDIYTVLDTLLNQILLCPLAILIRIIMLYIQLIVVRKVKRKV